MSERKASHRYGIILKFCQSLEIETCWKENAVDAFMWINVQGAVEELMKKQAI